MTKEEKTKNIISLIINSVILISSIISMLLYVIPGHHFYMGFVAFKFYTNLSNIYLAIASGCYMYINIKSIRNNKIINDKNFTLLKFYSIITTTITFVVVLVFLGPTIGYPPMFGNPQNCFFHAINPILGIVSFLLVDQKEKIEFKHTLYAFIFTGAYAIFYAIYMPITGDDFYGFNKNGVAILILILFLILGTNFGLANLYRFIGNKLNNQIINRK